MAVNYYDTMASGSVITYLNWNSMINDIYTSKAGGLSGNVLWKDGTRALTANWDAGNYTIEANAFSSQNISSNIVNLNTIQGNPIYFKTGSTQIMMLESVQEQTILKGKPVDTKVFSIYSDTVNITPRIDLYGSNQGSLYQGDVLLVNEDAGCIRMMDCIDNYLTFYESADHLHATIRSDKSEHDLRLETESTPIVLNQIRFDSGNRSWYFSSNAQMPWISTQTVSSNIIKGYQISSINNIYLENNIYHKGDTDTSINFTDDYITFIANNVELMEMGDFMSHDTLIINPNLVDMDTRINGSTVTLFYGNAGTGEVGIGDLPNGYTLDVNGSLNADTCVSSAILKASSHISSSTGLYSHFVSANNINANGIVSNWVSSQNISGATTEFTKLTDTPSSYTGKSSYAPLVNVAETALDFGDIVCTESEVVVQDGNVIWAHA